VASRDDTRPELPLDPDAPSLAPRPLHLRPGAAAVVAVGGLAGTAARYGLALGLPTPVAGWPAATFVVNLVGAFLLGSLLEALARSGSDAGWRRRVRLLAGTGFCGSLTTYSTFAVEADLLVRNHAAWLAAGYLGASLIGGVAATAAGIAAATGHHRYRRRRTDAVSTAASTGGTA
jgi:CrcB protein